MISGKNMMTVMNEFKHHVPRFVDMGNAAPHSFEFETTDELLNDPVVMSYANDKIDYHYCMSDELLMIEYDGGQRWIVIGYIENPEDVDLPQWISPRDESVSDPEFQNKYGRVVGITRKKWITQR